MIAGSAVNDLEFGQDEKHPYCVKLKLSICERILNLCDQGIIDFFTTAERGVAFYAAEAVIAARHLRPSYSPRLHIVMPYENQANRWSSDLQERFYQLHADAYSVDILQTQYTKDCYSKADEFMLKQCSVFLTDNGNSALAKIAKRKGKQVELLSESDATPARRRVLFPNLTGAKRIAVVAAVCVVFAATLAQGISMTFVDDKLVVWFRELMSSDGNKHVVFFNEIREYGSVEELIEAENVDILFPTNQRFERFEAYNIGDILHIVITTTEPFVRFSVDINAGIIVEQYFVEWDGFYQVGWTENGNYYRVLTTDSLLLSEIIENLVRN